MPYLLTCTVIVQYRQTSLKQLFFVWQQKTSTILKNVSNVLPSNCRRTWKNQIMKVGHAILFYFLYGM